MLVGDIPRFADGSQTGAGEMNKGFNRSMAGVQGSRGVRVSGVGEDERPEPRSRPCTRVGGHWRNSHDSLATPVGRNKIQA